MSYRFFGNFEKDKVKLSSEDIFHLTSVLRIRKGEEFEIIIGNELFICAVASFDPFTIKVIEKNVLPASKTCEITLFYALPKGDKLDFVVQKATELGVSHIILVDSENSVVKFAEKKQKAKLERFEKIIKSAAMQSKQDKIPTISGPIAFKRALELNYDLRLLAHEKASVPLGQILDKAMPNLPSIALFVGPEGGFSPAEIESAVAANYNIVSYGKSVLRSETAVIYGLSILHHYLEEEKS